MLLCSSHNPDDVAVGMGHVNNPGRILDGKISREAPERGELFPKRDPLKPKLVFALAKRFLDLLLSTALFRPPWKVNC